MQAISILNATIHFVIFCMDNVKHKYLVTFVHINFYETAEVNINMNMSNFAIAFYFLNP